MIKALPRIERRSADYKLLRALEAFEPASIDLAEGTCGNIQCQFNGEFNKQPDGEWKTAGGIFNGKCFYDVVSAPMLLAKLVAGYRGLNVNAEGQDAYKVTWTVVLRHKKSKNVVTFYDWKGSASFGSNQYEAKGAFKKDLTALLLALADDAFPHPYDGCRIGEIA